MPQMVTLRLTLQQAAMVHTLTSTEEISMTGMARFTGSLPLASRMFTEAATDCREVRQMIEEQVPDFRESTEQQRIRDRRAAMSE